MEILGELLIGNAAVRGTGPTFTAFDPRNRTAIDPEFAGATIADVDHACALANQAFTSFRATRPELRASFLDAIAVNLEAIADTIVARAMTETGLPEARCRNELGRTTGQLRMFARVVRDGYYLDARIDPALADRTPPRADIRLVNQPLGPVVVFGASNFPLAFSVAGGDTASALAAGCPVIVKAHHAHPGTSELAGRVIQRAVAECGLHEGVFSLLFGDGREIGSALVADPRVQAVGFTGSRQGGTALMAVAQARRQPIPVYAEMSSINPVVLLPGALAERGEAIGTAFAASVTLGAGQFCTNPGLLLAIDGPGLESFIEGTRVALAAAPPAPMLTPGIHQAYCHGVSQLEANPRVKRLIAGLAGEGFVCQANLFETSASDFLGDASLSEEVFGATALLVRCANAGQLQQVVDALEGQLTASVHAAESDLELAGSLMPSLERTVGRILFNGFGTGVEVCDAMVHGGPYPSTSDGRSTSVGSLAIMRFLRPICYQDLPPALLPPAIQDDNPFGNPQLLNGKR
ncbi:MAG: aldehyde dehydrogenase (NADP(+)) [Betaproteobacteria bacterium]|nr:aldehyde dehydrogenase (NADP(+)) [Betaproteobacteria bacterium]